jgi:pyruvate formate lyase activating enzyme
MDSTRHAECCTRGALLQEAAGCKIRCNTCERRCEVVDGGLGWCRTRKNRGGRLVTLIYGALSSLAANPIEKKPFFHFHPGTAALTAGSWSCNFACPWCQNWDITKVDRPPCTTFCPPGRFVDMVPENGCRGTSISFNEPSLSLEWSLDVFRTARGRGYYNTFVTNGYMTAEALDLLIDAGLDAINVDIKGDAAALRRYCGLIDGEKVWATCRHARARGIHLEITTLLIPGVNDDEAVVKQIASRIAAELGRETPWHVSGYYPSYEFTVPATPLETLERAWRIGKDAGLQYGYIGNVAEHPHENTYCTRCGCLLIARSGFQVRLNRLQLGQCSECGLSIPGIWGG